MFSIKFFTLILAIITPFPYALMFKETPLIVFTQGVIENENSSPISFFWYHLNFTTGDRIWVHVSSTKREYTEHFEIESYTGFYELPRSFIEHGESPDKCCAAILSKGQTLGTNCLNKSKIQWMYERREALKSFFSSDLVIPGTHQSAAYAKSENESLNDQSFISRWIFCQTKSIKTQLIEGIRYLDLRPSFLYIDGRKEYIITHGAFNLIPMDDLVRQINDFMDMSKDIVIVSFKEFTKDIYNDLLRRGDLNSVHASFEISGFDSIQDHIDFIAYLEFSFGRHSHSRRFWTYALDNFWQNEKRLILSYDHYTYVTSHYMWAPIPQHWADVQTIGQMHQYLSELHKNHKEIFLPYAAMVEFTHSVTTIVQDAVRRDMSLRHWAERLGKYIPRWYTEEWSSTANIVAVDYYQTSGIVDIAIQLNEKRAADPSFLYNRRKYQNRVESFKAPKF